MSTDLTPQNEAPVVVAQPRWKTLLEQAMPKIARSLPDHVTEKKFHQVAATAFGKAPMLRECLESNPTAVLNALADCAADGLLPDNRQATLTPFKDRRANRVNLTYIPMIAGVLMRMRNSGEVATITARCVFANERFSVSFGDDERIEHEPSLGSDPGAFVAAYAIIKFKDGSVEREVMPKREIDKVRNTSRSKDKGPWASWYEEMAKKTVIKRLAKRCPFSTDIMAMLDRDNSFYDPSKTVEGTITPAQERFDSLRAKDHRLTFDGTAADTSPDAEHAICAFIDGLPEIADLGVLASAFSDLEQSEDWAQATEEEQARAKEAHSARAHELLAEEADEADFTDAEDENQPEGKAA